MRHRHHRWPLLWAALLAACPALGPAADPPAKAPARLDVSKLPPGTIFVVGEDAKDALLQPGVMVLTPEKYKDLLEQLDQLKRQVNPDKPEPPSSCVITGRADDTTVYLQATFHFETRRPKTTVALGCQKAWPTAATLDDGKLPLLPPPGEDGFVAQIETPGNHRLTLDLEVPITGRTGNATDRGFELALPRAVITRLEQFDVPGGVRDLRINSRWVTANTLAGNAEPRRFVALGAADRLEITWKGPTPQEQAEPVREATGQIDVRFDDTHVTTEAELVLSMLRGRTKQWQILVPAAYIVELVTSPSDDRTPELVKPTDPKEPIWTVKWKEPSNTSVKLRIRSYQQRQGKIGVGPFTVLQALRQQGTITVSVPPELRMKRCQAQGDIVQRELTEEQRRTGTTAAAFYYWNMPAKPNNQLGTPPLELEVENVKGAVETTLAHTLKLTAEGWRLTTDVEVNPVRIGIDRLEVDLPPDFLPKAGPLLLVEPDLEVRDGTGGHRLGVIKLAQRQTRPFKLTLEGPVPLRCSGDGVPALAELPRLLQTVDGGARVSVEVPEDDELVVAREVGHAPLGAGRKEANWRSKPSPSRIEVAWRPRTAELPVESVADVTIADGKARIRQSFRFQFAHEPDRQLVLRGPEMPLDVIPTVDHAPLVAHGPGLWLTPLNGAAVTVEYAVPLPKKKGKEFDALSVPLLWPVDATRCQTRVRVWTDAGLRTTTLAGPWEELPPEVVAERETLPALVVRADGLSVPLQLRLGETTALHAATTVDRTLIQVTAPEGKFQTYRCRFLLSRASRSVELEFPAAVAGLNLEIYVGGKRVLNPTVIDEQGKESETGHAVRIRLAAEAGQRPLLLEARYQLAFGRGEGLGRFVTVLAPPHFLGNVFPGPIRWQVGLGPDRIPIYWGGEASLAQRWSWRGPLLTPQPAVTAADLESWIGGEGAPGSDAGEASRTPDLVGWQTAAGPISLVQMPRQAWLLGCSLAVLLVGLGIYFAPWQQFLRGTVAVVVGLAALATGLWWPTILVAVLYGVEPGTVVLLTVVALLWLLHRRYRRQVVFMPGFSRPAVGSSIVRNGSGSNRRRSEPSTVDSPTKLTGEIASRKA